VIKFLSINRSQSQQQLLSKEETISLKRNSLKHQWTAAAHVYLCLRFLLIAIFAWLLLWGPMVERFLLLEEGAAYTQSASVWAAPAHSPVEVNPGCADLIQNGDFEQFHPAWQILPSSRPAAYRTDQTFNSSTYALRLGNDLESPNVESISEIRHMSLTLPPGATSIILRFRYWPLVDGTPDVFDIQQADIFDALTEQLLDQPLLVQDNSQSWKLVNRDITAFAGREISLRFRVRNNGLGARTLMYVDNVEIEYCPAPGTGTPTQWPTAVSTTTPTATASVFPLTTTATPTSILTPTPTQLILATETALPTLTATAVGTAVVSATPTAYVPPVIPPVIPTADPSCTNILVDPSFEGWNGWHFGEDPVPPIFVSIPAHSGIRAVQLGNPPEQPTNVITFSSVRQLVTVPYNVSRAELRWWKQLRSTENGVPHAQSDRQDLILLSPSLQPITILRREWRNDGIDGYWQEDVVDITAYRGQTFYVYFNAFNDGVGARTWMYLDDVQLNICNAVWAGAQSGKDYLVNTPVAIPLTSAPTDTPATLPTPSPLPTKFVTATGTPTNIPIAALPPIATVAATPPVLVTAAALALSPTSNVYGVPTLPPAVVVVTETPSAQSAGSSVVTVAPPTVGAVATGITERAPWMDRLGPISVLLGILILIGFIIGVIVRTFRQNRQP